MRSTPTAYPRGHCCANAEQYNLDMQTPNHGSFYALVLRRQHPSLLFNCSHNAFTVPHFNRDQSKLYPTAFGTDEPILLCAPTSAGKVTSHIVFIYSMFSYSLDSHFLQTNVAMLTILNETAKHRNQETGEFDHDAYKCVHIAPMRALAPKMVGNVTQRLKIVITTPEKRDVIIPKQTDTSYTNLVLLIIADKIHAAP
ncbi:hypothetical protein D9619_011891 [Psilocybe cf. subviscida]|uniref:DEAD/DEAH box helicase domain-containing protein n=1 Tax=Psilocybe cf. subviscida TaxID=2480587 RepID=A0A8H5B285_9AGAR|nr:hypothetical protein D9619_007872 [Psilocybe cf. subviscida]KAF5314377.1 hypothetical protein D9619_011891 [Psilocybe cf. subviscida]